MRKPYLPGERIHHTTLGNGTVIKEDTANLVFGDSRLVIKFDLCDEEKELVLCFARGKMRRIRKAVK